MTHQPKRDAALDVVDAARAAWQWAGSPSEVLVLDEVPGVIAALAIPKRRCIEFYVGRDHDGTTWSEVLRWTAREAAQVCSVVPLSSLGRAHEALRGSNSYLQAWWLDVDGRIAFGAMERA
jgi:hypothetical protein